MRAARLCCACVALLLPGFQTCHSYKLQGILDALVQRRSTAHADASHPSADDNGTSDRSSVRTSASDEMKDQFIDGCDLRSMLELDSQIPQECVYLADRYCNRGEVCGDKVRSTFRGDFHARFVERQSPPEKVKRWRCVGKRIRGKPSSLPIIPDRKRDALIISA
eukprot:scaffold1561_cov404-Prasinococcus_capsulatus_cf.AAC.4